MNTFDYGTENTEYVENVGKTVTFDVYEFRPKYGKRMNTGEQKIGKIRAWQSLPFLAYQVEVEGDNFFSYVYPGEVVSIED